MTTASLALELDKIRPTLYRFAMLQLRNESIAEDVVQETLLAALEGKSAFSGRSQLKTWAVSILRNKIVDHLRRSSREGALPFVDDQGDADFDAMFDGSGHWQEKPTDWGRARTTWLLRRARTVHEGLARKYRARFHHARSARLRDRRNL